MQFENIILIGYRGSGKTTVARTLATRLGWTGVDADELIEARAGRSIRDIFDQDGEAGFRRLEADIIREVCSSPRQVISVGGGAVLSPVNRGVLRQAGFCVWLTAPPEELERRIQADARTTATRPALTAYNAAEEIRRLLQEREPLYASLADHVVNTAGQPVDDVADAILRRLSEPSG